MGAIRVLLGDDHTLVRHGIRRILEEHQDVDVVAEAVDGREAVRKALELTPDVAVLDVAMPGLSGIEATRQIVRRAPSVGVLMLSMHAEEGYVVQSLRAGAKGYVLKDSADADLLSGIAAVAAGKSFFSPAVARVMLDEYMRAPSERGLSDRYDTLSDREREIFQLLAEGRSNKDVSVVLSISPATVETHRARVFRKLDVHNAAELVLYAVHRGVVS
jgi:two-component system response regulator NreC